MKLKDKQMDRVPELEKVPEVMEQRPPSVGYCMSSMFCRYEKTNCYQWWCNRTAGFWEPYGDVFYFTNKQVEKLIG